jgi:hypothetical protein
MSGGNAGNTGNLQSLGNSGLFDPAAKRRESAEIGGNWQNHPAETLFGKSLWVWPSHSRHGSPGEFPVVFHFHFSTTEG